MKNKQKNWLEDMFLFFNATKEFVDEMNKQLPNQYDEIVFKKLDWNKIKLFIEPRNDSKELYFLKDFLNNKYEAYIQAQVEYKGYSMGTLIQYSVDSPNKIYPDKYNGTQEIEFYVLHLCLNRFIRDLLPVEGKEDSKSKIPLSYTFKFPIFCENQKAFFHEGYFLIDIEKIHLVEIEKVIGQSLMNWNSDEEYPEIKIVPQERGFFHSFRFEGWEDGKAKFYFDNGSAADGIFEYVFSQLDKSDISIKSIEIIGV